MNWVRNQWLCPECGVDVGQVHADHCAMFNTDVEATTVWCGPPASKGLVARLVVPGDVWLSDLYKGSHCLNCQSPRRPGEIVFETPDQETFIHAKCILTLAGQVPRSGGSVADVEGEYQRRLAELT